MKTVTFTERDCGRVLQSFVVVHPHHRITVRVQHVSTDSVASILLTSSQSRRLAAALLKFANAKKGAK